MTRSPRRDIGNNEKMRALVDLPRLENSAIVANCRMNRERGIRGTNSYAADLGFDVIQFLTERLEAGKSVAWLDLCCGARRALIQAAECFQHAELAGRVTILGLDLVDMFSPVPHPPTRRRLVLRTRGQMTVRDFGGAGWPGLSCCPGADRANWRRRDPPASGPSPRVRQAHGRPAPLSRKG